MQIKESTISVYDALDLCLKNKLTFAAYKLPGQDEITIIVQEDHNVCELTDISELTDMNGFLIVPFFMGRNEKTILIRPDIIIKTGTTDSYIEKIKSIVVNQVVNDVKQIIPYETKEQEFLDQVEKAVGAIKKDTFQKAVISRVKIVDGEYTSRLSKIFGILCESYINSFIYIFRINGHCWIGASPEPFMCSRGNEFTTVSLAGTRPYSEKNIELQNWNSKELKEQEYVTSYIEDILKEFKVDEYSKKGPYTKKAGKLLHLRTDFIFSMQSLGKKLYSFIAALHPTSAVCGMPLKKSRDFILATEKHNREYYSGIIGPVGIDGHFQLFVNLRCMKVYSHQLALFVGGGITSDSNPKEEWEETEIKTDTLLSVVKQVH